MRLVLTGGGTGGHIYPALAIAEAFAAEPSFAPLEVSFVGTRAGLEASIVPKAHVPLAFVQAAPLVRPPSFAIVRTMFLNTLGFFQALAILHRLRPDVLIATGGYVTFPVVAALRAARLVRLTRARIVLFESNATAGLTNRLLGPLADEIWYAHPPPGRARRKSAVVGMPVRASLRRAVASDEARRALGLSGEGTIILVMGGSQGAHSLNEAVAGLVEGGLPSGWQVVLIAGPDDLAALRVRLSKCAGVTLCGYLDDPHNAYAAADLVVARAGASTLGELAATGTPALLVPYPYATDDHQTLNARAFAASGAAVILADADVNATRLRWELERLLAPAVLAPLRAAAVRLRERAPQAAVVARVRAWSLAKAPTR